MINKIFNALLALSAGGVTFMWLTLAKTTGDISLPNMGILAAGVVTVAAVKMAADKLDEEDMKNDDEIL